MLFAHQISEARASVLLWVGREALLLVAEGDELHDMFVNALGNIGDILVLNKRATQIHCDTVLAFHPDAAGSEALAVDRPIEDARGDEAVTAQSAEKGQRPPMAVRGKTPHPLALRPPSA